MPTVTLDKALVEKLMGKKLPLDQLKDRIAMLGTDLEHIEGNDINVEIFPNRPDVLCEQGFARALSSFIGVKTGLKKYDVKKSDYQVFVKDVEVRPYTACAVVKNLTFNDQAIKSFVQLQEKLASTHGRRRKKSAYGIYPLDVITWPISYVGKDPKKVTYTPLGMQKPIPASKTEELHPKGREYKHIAKGWKTYPFFIDAKEEVLSMLPYTNSEKTGKIDASTKDVFIECSGTDLANVQVALNIIVSALADMGGEIYTVDIVFDNKTITTPNLKPKEMKCDLTYINKWLGLSLSEKELEKHLAHMGIGYEKGTALIPAYRADIIHPVDLTEEVAIAYGYENFKEEIPEVATIGEEDPLEKKKRLLSSMLANLGLLEAETYHVSNAQVQKEKMLLDDELIELASAVNTEYNVLRRHVLSSLLEVLTQNKNREYPQNIFTLGTTFRKGTTETGVLEEERLGVVLCSDQADFTKIKQILDVMSVQLGLSIEIKEKECPSFIPGRSAEVLVNKKPVGIIGEVHPQVLENFQIEHPVAAMELLIENL